MSARDGPSGGSHSGVLPPLLSITDAERVGVARTLAVASKAWRGGLRWVLVREPNTSPDGVRELFCALRERELEGLHLSIACRPGSEGELRMEQILPLSPSGIHLGRASPEAVRGLRRHAGAGVWIGYSAHTLEEAKCAIEEGADYVTFAPVFPPLSKTRSGEAAGLESLRAVSASAGGPVFALGGVTPARAASVHAAGAYGAAVIGAITDAADPEAAARALLATWSSPEDF